MYIYILWRYWVHWQENKKKSCGRGLAEKLNHRINFRWPKVSYVYMYMYYYVPKWHMATVNTLDCGFLAIGWLCPKINALQHSLILLQVCTKVVHACKEYFGLLFVHKTCWSARCTDWLTDLPTLLLHKPSVNTGEKSLHYKWKLDTFVYKNMIKL